MSAPDGLTELFKEVVLVLGGAFAVHPVRDEVVRAIARGLEGVYRRAARRQARAAAAAPHPAITRLLHIKVGDRRGSP